MVTDTDPANNTAFDKMITLFRQTYWVSDYITVIAWTGVNYTDPDYLSKNSITYIADHIPTKDFNLSKFL